MELQGTIEGEEQLPVAEIPVEDEEPSPELAVAEQPTSEMPEPLKYQKNSLK